VGATMAQLRASSLGRLQRHLALRNHSGPLGNVSHNVSHCDQHPFARNSQGSFPWGVVFGGAPAGPPKLMVWLVWWGGCLPVEPLGGGGKGQFEKVPTFLVFWASL